MHKLLVVGISETSSGRRLFEDRFALVLTARGVEAVPSHRLVPSDDRISRETLTQAIRGHGFEGVVVTRLVGVEEETTWVPPTTQVVPGGYGPRSLYGYYGPSWDVMHTPGYVETHTTVVLETRLFDARDEELVWSARSETLDPKERQEAIDSVTQKISEQLAEENLLPR
jgi:hypothetical protein